MAFWMLAAQTALGVVSGAMASNAQNDLYNQNADAAITSNMYEDRGINEGLREEQDIASAKRRDIQRQSLELQSQAKATGRQLSGVSVDRDQQHIQNKAGEALAALNANLAGKTRQTEADKRGTAAKAQSRINSVARSSYNPLLDIASGGLAIAGDFDATKASKAKVGDSNYSFKDYATSWLGG